MSGNENVYVAEDGSYQLGILHGHAVPVEAVRYIGKEARKRHRERLIEDLDAKIAECKERVREYQSEEQNLQQKLEKAKRTWASFPQVKDVRSAYDETVKAKNSYEAANEWLNRLAEQVQALDREFQELKKKLFRATEGISLRQESEAYQEALHASRMYEKALVEINRVYDQWKQTSQDLEREEQLLEETEEEVDGYKGELAVYEDRLEKVSQRIADIEEQQRLAGADEIKEEIRATKEAQSAVKTERDALMDQLPRERSKLEQDEQRKWSVEKSLTFWRNMEAAWYRSLETEWPRGARTGESVDEEEVKALIASQSLSEKAQLEGQLTNLYYKLQSDLIEHKMSLYGLPPEEEAWMKEVTKNEWRPLVEQWKNKATRNVLEFDQRGVKISPRTLYETISNQWSEHENRLDAMDKELYEEILLHSVGHKLRGRIRRAEQWTEKMKQLMESRDTSSGLKFSIRWRPKTADSEQEMDTKDLVALLKQDAKLLKQDDLDRMTTHFRSKIGSAKQWLEEKGEGETLLQILKMVLDYRKWFSFELYFERPNESRRELTNHQFFKFSGGEKAMAMYIPLFTACYSRYQEAANFAPYIISLDEAFAGVDENNINEMFEIVEQLEFDYIMNSQVLWGDYEAISTLSVCELIRPKNASHVSVIRYKWDGNAMALDLKGQKQEYEPIT
nr:SbcC/MukB-like Walker B domain-containing protein [Shouchella shacheensis]